MRETGDSAAFLLICVLYFSQNGILISFYVTIYFLYFISKPCQVFLLLAVQFLLFDELFVEIIYFEQKLDSFSSVGLFPTLDFLLNLYDIGIYSQLLLDFSQHPLSLSVFHNHPSHLHIEFLIDFSLNVTVERLHEFLQNVLHILEMILAYLAGFLRPFE